MRRVGLDLLAQPSNVHDEVAGDQIDKLDEPEVVSRIPRPRGRPRSGKAWDYSAGAWVGAEDAPNAARAVGLLVSYVCPETRMPYGGGKVGACL